MDLMPVCRGVGGGPAGCCADGASASRDLSSDGCNVDGASAPSFTGASPGCRGNRSGIIGEHRNSAGAFAMSLIARGSIDCAWETPLVMAITAMAQNPGLRPVRMDSSLKLEIRVLRLFVEIRG
jgi:hypothetical protein